MRNQSISKVVNRTLLLPIAGAACLLLLFGYGGKTKLEAAANSDAAVRAKALVEANVPQIAADLIQGTPSSLSLRLMLLRANFAESKLEVKVWDKTLQPIYESELFAETYPNTSQIEIGERSHAGRWMTSIKAIRDGLNTVGFVAFSVGVDQSSSTIFRSFVYQSVIILLLVLGVIIWALKRMLQRNVVDPIRLLVEGLPSMSKMATIETSKPRFAANDFYELNSLSNELITSYRRLREHTLAESQLSIELAAEKARVLISQQVAHDIRSPLSALNMVVKSLSETSEEKRVMLRTATQRINDIANGLLRPQEMDSAKRSTGIAPEQVDLLKDVMLIALLDAIVSEKRMQYRENMAVEIQADLHAGYGLFAEVPPADFSRTISNLVNNSVEALAGGGRVTVAINGGDHDIDVVVRDTGKGIPSEILARIGERGISYGKDGGDSGSGLGLYHARKTVESSGGKLTIESQVGKGTTVTMTLPRARTPKWFVESLRLGEGLTVISVDDDQTIHQVWAERLQSVDATRLGIKHLAFSSLSHFEDFLKVKSAGESLFLVDYEFLGQDGTGLDVIERTGIRSNTVLVTSRFEETRVRLGAEKLGIRILPKVLAPVVPLSLKKELRKYDAVLIDDDVELIHASWKMAATEQGKSILCFSGADEFFEMAPEIHRASPLFIDLNLGDGQRGDVIVTKAFEMGFDDIALATGSWAENQRPPTGARRIIGKDPIF